MPTTPTARFAIVQNPKAAARIRALSAKLPSLRYLIVLEEDSGARIEGRATLALLQEKGDKALAKRPDLIQTVLDQRDPGSMAALIYTSGTTGRPKGVVLTERAFIYTIRMLLERFYGDENDRGVSLLPPWHVYERILEYYSAVQGIDFLVTSMSTLRDDLREFRPTIFPSVPRIWESVYNGIMAKVAKESVVKQKIFGFCLAVGRAWARNVAVLRNYDPSIQKPFILTVLVKRLWALIVLWFLLVPKLFARKVFSNISQALGGRLRISVSGGGALPAHVDRFLSAIGILAVEGYGMTEVCGLISVRSTQRPTPGTLGRPLRGYQIRLKDDAGVDVSGQPGKKGVLWVKTDQLFDGYFREEELTKSLFDADGFYDTGDVMLTTWRGELVFAGRAKDTIVLTGGENLEPSPIEDRLLESNYIDQVVVVGSERKTLAALIVPNVDRVREAVPMVPESTETWNRNPDVRALFKREIGRLITREKGFKPFETIPGNHFTILSRPFDPDTEMTRTLKIKRNVVFQNYAAVVEAIYEK